MLSAAWPGVSLAEAWGWPADYTVDLLVEHAWLNWVPPVDAEGNPVKPKPAAGSLEARQQSVLALYAPFATAEQMQMVRKSIGLE